MELAKGKQRSKWKEEFERQLDATEAAVLERDGTIEALTAEIKGLKKVKQQKRCRHHNHNHNQKTARRRRMSQ